MRRAAFVAMAAAFVLAMGCTMTKKATDFNGLADMDGKKVTHLNTTNVAVHLLFKKPVWGNATLQQAVANLTMKAKDMGATEVRIVQSDTYTYWWVLPPISFIIHPVTANVAADVR